MALKNMEEFPDGALDKNLSDNAGDSGSRKITHAAEQLSLCTTTTEACIPRACAPQEKPSREEALKP